jgi:hypothetical protein
MEAPLFPEKEGAGLFVFRQKEYFFIEATHNIKITTCK